MVLQLAFAIKGPEVGGVPTLQHSPAELRAADAGEVVRTTTRVPRAGVLPAHTNSLASPVAGTRKLTIGPFVAVLTRGASYGVVKVANVGNDESPEFPAAPGSNSRIDVLWLRQNDSIDASVPDANDLPVWGITSGDVSAGTPTAPAVPAGATPFFEVLRPAGAPNLDSAGVTITDVYPYTAMQGGTVLLRNQAEQDAWTPHNGSDAYRLDTSVTLKRRAGLWVPILQRGTFTGATNADGLVVIGHGLGVTPASVQVTMRLTGVTDLVARLMEVRLQNRDATQFYVRNLRRDTNAWHQDYISFDWLAVA